MPAYLTYRLCYLSSHCMDVENENLNKYALFLRPDNASIVSSLNISVHVTIDEVTYARCTGN